MAALRVSFGTQFASERFLAGVHDHVVLQSFAPDKSLATNRALVRLHAQMVFHVHTQVAAREKSTVAYFTFVGPFVFMKPKSS